MHKVASLGRSGKGGGGQDGEARKGEGNGGGGGRCLFSSSVPQATLLVRAVIVYGFTNQLLAFSTTNGTDASISEQPFLANLSSEHRKNQNVQALTSYQLYLQIWMSKQPVD